MEANDNVNYLLYNHISPSTKCTYDAGMKQFREFCAKERTDISMTTTCIILPFIAELFNEKIALTTVQVYLASIAIYFVELGTSASASYRITRCLKGYARTCLTPSDHRPPITLEIMRLLKRRLRGSSVSQYDQKLYWCACFFCAYLRVSEFTSSSA